LLLQGAPTAVSAGPRAPAGGTRVAVTKEMLGAGAVSSGVALPPAPPVTGSRRAPVPSWGKPLPYPILIADRRNNRLIEVTPDKRVVWEFPSPDLAIYRGNEDVNFSPDGRRLAVSEEDNYDLNYPDGFDIDVFRDWRAALGGRAELTRRRGGDHAEVAGERA
jgi:hypothetical protein